MRLEKESSLSIPLYEVAKQHTNENEGVLVIQCEIEGPLGRR